MDLRMAKFSAAFNKFYGYDATSYLPKSLMPQRINRISHRCLQGLITYSNQCNYQCNKDGYQQYSNPRIEMVSEATQPVFGGPVRKWTGYNS
jgi:hypothetical protein